MILSFGTSDIPCNVALHPVPFLPNMPHVAVTLESFYTLNVQLQGSRDTGVEPFVAKI